MLPCCYLMPIPPFHEIRVYFDIPALYNKFIIVLSFIYIMFHVKSKFHILGTIYRVSDKAMVY